MGGFCVITPRGVPNVASYRGYGERVQFHFPHGGLLMTMRSMLRFFLRRHFATLLSAAALLAGLSPSTDASAASNYTLFESGQVRPIALSPDGQLLFVVNTPDNRLEIFRVGHNGLTHRASVPVGLEPVAVAARSNH